MNLSQFKPFKYYSFYDDSIYNQTFEIVTPSWNETVLYTENETANWYWRAVHSICRSKNWTGQTNTHMHGDFMHLSFIA
jgi:hypothetical protein